MQYPKFFPILLCCAALLACNDGAVTDADGGSGECLDNQPGSSCVDPDRFDFEDGDVDIVGDLKKKGINFELPKDGFQITTQGVKLGSQEDDEWCEAFEVPEDPENPDREWCITRFEVAMTAGYHHLFVAKAPIGSPSEKLMEVGKRVRCVGGAHVVYGSDLGPIPLPQDDYVDVPYYPGVGERLKPGQKISVNYHYLNVTDDSIVGVTKINFHAAPCDGLREMGQFGFYNQDIAVPPHGKYSTTMNATFTQDVYVWDLFRHTHRWGTDVPISFYKGPRDGELIFNSPDYELGAGYRFEEPVLVKKGEGFTFVCNFENTTDDWIRFGPTADDEMCMLLGTWWIADPKEEPVLQHRYKWQSDD
jgi:Copper type II ascorbate-dependent monooxygenase, C-terminal domain